MPVSTNKQSPLALALLSGTAVFAVAAVALADPPSPPPLPPEAYSACASKAAGDACTVQIHDHTIEGTCAAMPSEQRLHCRPNGPPPGPPPNGR